MTIVCPSGHESKTSDYCDQCGAPMADAWPVVEEIDTSAAALHEPCPVCSAPRSGDDRYCEGCGHDFLSLTDWEAVVYADRVQFDRLASEGLSFPECYGERRYRLTGAEVRIGRRRARAGELPPEIDLAGEPEDPGISHSHAILERQANGGYAIRDLGSTNGTTLNDDPASVGTEQAVTLRSGDLIRLGAWTTIAVHSH
jgi:FHA domain-containing protein